MSLEQIPGQRRAKRFLTQMIRKGQMPHALLFSGMAGIGKKQMGVQLAKALNCLAQQGDDACDACASCRKIDAGTHPDLLLVRSQGAFIKVDQIRELKERVQFRPFEARWRVVIIEEAQNLKEEAANAILKLLEEPPRQNLLILTVLEPHMLLPTIVSRCCHIRFQPLDDATIESFLTREGRLPLEAARAWLPLASGSLERAKELTDGRWIEHMREIVAEVLRLCEVPMIDFFSVTGQWAKKTEDLDQDLECIKLFLCALICGRLHLPPILPMQSVDPKLLDLALSAPVETLFDLYEETEEALRRLRFNANKQLTLEHICLVIREGLNGESDRNTLPKRR